MPLHKTFLEAGELRAYRAKADLKQSELASKLGVSARVLANWERGRTEIPAEVYDKLFPSAAPASSSAERKVTAKADTLRAGVAKHRANWSEHYSREQTFEEYLTRLASKRVERGVWSNSDARYLSTLLAFAREHYLLK